MVLSKLETKKTSSPSQSQLRLRIEGRIGRRFKRLIEPSEQVAMDEELLAQQRHQIGQRPTPGGAQLKIFQQEHGDQRRPDLNFERVGACADETLHPQILFEGAKEDLHLPALAVDAG